MKVAFGLLLLGTFLVATAPAKADSVRNQAWVAQSGDDIAMNFAFSLLDVDHVRESREHGAFWWSHWRWDTTGNSGTNTGTGNTGAQTTSNAVPTSEPSTLLLLGSGLIGVFSLRRKLSSR